MRGAGRRWCRGVEVRIRARSGMVIVTLLVLAVGPVVFGLLEQDPEATRRAAASLVVLGPALLVLLLASGGVAGDVARGTAPIWLQKPVAPALLYLDRLVPRLVLGILVPLVAVAVTLVVLAVAGPPDSIGWLLEGLPRVVLVCITLVVFSHAVSGLGLRPEPLWVILLLVGLLLLRVYVVGQQPTGFLAPLIDLAVLPVDRLDATARLLAGGSPVDGRGWEAAVWVALHFIFWIGVGTAASLVTLRSPLPRESD